jgi:hypothetical protein
MSYRCLITASRRADSAVPEEEHWGFAFYTDSHERYEFSMFPSGELLGSPEDAFDVSAPNLATTLGLWLNLADQEIACAGGPTRRGPQAPRCGGATIGGGPARSLTDEATRLDAP